MASACLQRMGFTLAAATELTSAGGQDLSTKEEYGELDSDGQSRLWRLLARPVGLNPNGVRDEGIKTSSKAQTNFGLMCYYINHLTKRADRATTWTAITLPLVKSMKPQMLQESTAKDPTVVPTIDFKNWPRSMESLENYIRGHMGVDKTPLSYTIRTELFPPRATDDPTFGAAGSVYSSIDEEIIGRHRIVDQSVATLALEEHEKVGPFDEQFRTDNTRLWELLSNILADTDANVVLKPYKKLRNGRGAWRALHQHDLGPNNVDHMAAAAEKELDGHRYNGESRNYSLEQHILTHLKAHAILEDLKEFGYHGIDERSKVRKFVDSIKTKSLDTIKGQIMASADLRTDFDKCTTLFKDFLAQDKINGIERSVSAVGIEGAPSLSYVPKEEWNNMTQAQKDEIDAGRKAQKARRSAKGEGGGKGGGGGGGGGGKNKGKDNAKSAKWKKRGIAKLISKAVDRKIKALSSKAGDDDEDSEEEQVPMKDAHALRQPAKKKKSGN